MATNTGNIDGNTSNEIKLYPNPANNEVLIELTNLESSDITLNVYDVLGKLVYSDNAKKISGSFKQSIDVSQLTRGIYVVKINDNVNTYFTKLILQ